MMHTACCLFIELMCVKSFFLLSLYAHLKWVFVGLFIDVGTIWRSHSFLYMHAHKKSKKFISTTIKSKERQ